MNRKERRSAKSQGTSQGLAAQLLAEGVSHHQAGRLGDAERLYREVIASEPRNADALHLLGLIAYHSGHYEVAVERIGKAIRIRDNVSIYHNNIGNAFKNLNRLADAAAAYKRALTLMPEDPEVMNNLGVTLEAQGKIDEALSLYQQSLNIRPDYASAHYNTGNALHKKNNADGAVAAYKQALALDPCQVSASTNLASVLREQGKLAEALDYCDRALAIKPDHTETLVMKGIILRDQGRLDDAIACYTCAVQFRPDSVEAYNNMGFALNEQGKLEEALAAYQKAFMLQPENAQVRNNLGAALEELEQLDDAAVHYRHALKLQPDSAEIFYNLGNIAKKKGQLAEALDFYTRAITIRPDYAEARWNRAFVLLLTGNFDDGWRESEWRWRHKGIRSHDVMGPLWDGQSLTGKTILLQSEQGMGDSIQFIRYAPLVKAKGGRVILLCPPALARLFATAEGVDEIFTAADALPAYDCQAPLLSLPGLLGTTLATIPAKVPYLQADSARVAVWRERLQHLPGLKIGIVWRGNPLYKNDRSRSMKAEQFTRFLNVPGVSVVAIQKDSEPADIAALGVTGPFLNAAPLLGDFDDTAALIQSLDLVISTDTSVCHLAGALGVPVWALISFAPDWRWLLGRDDSPWYPSMRLFRQLAPGDWAAVGAAIAATLMEKIKVA